MHRAGRWLVAMAVITLSAPASWAAVSVGGDGPDALVGTRGEDSLYGAGGDDRLDGAGGSDALEGGTGADDLRGGTGNDDAVTYANSNGVTVTLDDARNDGGPGEGDNVHRDVEHVYGGPGGDRLTGSGRRNTLDGGAGRDRLEAAGGRDSLFGGDGSDILEARDRQADEADCGRGEDVLAADRADRVRRCEWVVDVLPAGRFVLVEVNQQFGLPKGTPRRRGCRGTVRIELGGRRRLARASARVDGRCRYRKDFAISAARVGKARRVKLVVRFSGNSAVAPAKFEFSRGVRVERLG